MKKMLSLLVAAVLVMGWSANSYAGNPYASANIGIAWFDDIEGTEVDKDERDDDSFDLLCSSGLTLAGAIGYDFGDVRAELELGHQNNDVSEIVDIGGEDAGDTYEGTGDIAITTFMLNGYYDIALMEDAGVELFLTAGVGAAYCNFDEVGEKDNDDDIGTMNVNSWAYQLGAGIAIPVGDGMMVDARYRYFNTGDMTSPDDYDGFNMISQDPYNFDISSHSALLGLRYNF